MTLSKFMQKWREIIPKESFEDMIKDLQEMFQPPEGKIWVETTVSHRDLRPLLSVKLGKYQFQINPEMARKLGTNFLDVAHAAELESYLYQFFCGEQGVPREQVGQLVAHFRQWREEHGKINIMPPEGAKQ